jgi:hypothetical protein
MQYYRCKCGEAQAWGSMSPAPCRGCSKCNTTLETHPDYHRTPEPHQFVTEYDANTGKPYRRCERCLKREVIGLDEEIERLLLATDDAIKSAGMDDKYNDVRKAIADALIGLGKIRVGAKPA